MFLFLLIRHPFYELKPQHVRYQFYDWHVLFHTIIWIHIHDLLKQHVGLHG